MDAIFLEVFNRSIAAGWLILAVIAVRFFLRKASRQLSCVLWALVAVRLLCPFSLESAFSLIPSGETISPEVVRYAQEPAITSGIPALNDALNPVLAEKFTPEPGVSVNPLQVWIFLMSIVWAAGIAVLLGYALIGFLRVRVMVREAAPLSGDLDVWACDTVEVPFLLGILRPRIYLPSGIEVEWLESILAHERVHIRRKDHWWKLLGYLLRTVYWFHPLVWAAYFLFCKDLELVCDEKVVSGMDLAGRKVYSHALLACGMHRKTTFSYPLAFGEAGVRERVGNVMHYRKPAVWAVGAAVLACAVVAVCFLTDPKENAANEGEETGQKYDVIPMVMVDDRYFYDTGRRITRADGIEEDGEITSTVEGWERPQENDQSNFGKGYPYRYYNEDMLEIYIGEDWNLFEYRSGDGSTIRYLDRWYSRSDLSEETIEWLEWYNSLPEEKQLAVSSVPYDLYDLAGDGNVSGRTVETEDAEPAVDTEALFAAFGIPLRLPGNDTWIQSKEYRQPEEDTVEVFYWDAIAKADCKLTAVRDGEPDLPEPDTAYDAAREESWMGSTASGQIVYVKVQRSGDGRQALATWEYDGGEHRYRFAVQAKFSAENEKEAKETDGSPIPKAVLSVISNLE